MKEYKEETLGQRIKAQRIRIGMTQDDLAEKLCIPKSTISAYENDKIDIKTSRITEISAALFTTPNYLLGYEATFNEDDEDLMGEIKIFLNSVENKKVKEIFVAQLKSIIEVFKTFI